MLKYSIWKHAPAAQHFVESTKCLLLRDALYTCSWPRFFSQKMASNRHVWLDACIKSAFLRDKDWCSILEAARKIVGLWGERNGGYWFGFHKQRTGVVVDYFACYIVDYFGFTCSKHVNPLPKFGKWEWEVFRVVIPTINSHLLQTSISTDGIKPNLWKKRVGLFVVPIMGSYTEGAMGWNRELDQYFKWVVHILLLLVASIWSFFVNFNPFTQNFHSSILLLCVFFQLDVCRLHWNNQPSPLESMEHSLRVLPQQLTLGSTVLSALISWWFARVDHPIYPVGPMFFRVVSPGFNKHLFWISAMLRPL